MTEISVDHSSRTSRSNSDDEAPCGRKISTSSSINVAKLLPIYPIQIATIAAKTTTVLGWVRRLV